MTWQTIRRMLDGREPIPFWLYRWWYGRREALRLACHLDDDPAPEEP